MDGPLGELLASIERLSEPASFPQLLALLNANEEMLIKHLPLLDDLLPVLSPKMNSLGMTFILCVPAQARTLPMHPATHSVGLRAVLAVLLSRLAV